VKIENIGTPPPGGKVARPKRTPGEKPPLPFPADSEGTRYLHNVWDAYKPGADEKWKPVTEQLHDHLVTRASSTGGIASHYHHLRDVIPELGPDTEDPEVRNHLRKLRTSLGTSIYRKTTAPELAPKEAHVGYELDTPASVHHYHLLKSYRPPADEHAAGLVAQVRQKLKDVENSGYGHPRLQDTYNAIASVYNTAPGPEHRDALRKLANRVVPVYNGTYRKWVNSGSDVKNPDAKGYNSKLSYLQKQERVGGEPGDIVSHGFASIEFHPKMSQKERKEHVTRAADALADLAHATGLKPKDLSLGGTLHLSFGGRDVKGAMAHYSPKIRQINLSRDMGAGNLAHEWAHAMSFHNGRKYPRSFNEAALKSGYLSRLRDTLQAAYHAGHIDNSGIAYYTNPEEIWARVFETWVQHRLAEDGRKNTYLAGPAPMAALWPMKDEMKHFDEPVREYLAQHLRNQSGPAQTAGG